MKSRKNQPGSAHQSLAGARPTLTGRRATCRCGARRCPRGCWPRTSAHFLTPIRFDAVPQCHRQGRRHLHRGCGRPPLHGFPRQQRASHRLRPSAAEARHRRADGCAAVRAAPLHVRAGGRAREKARRDRTGQERQGAVHDRRLGCHRGRDQDRARGDRPLQDAVVLGRLSRRGLRRRGGRRRGVVPLGPVGALDARCRACRAVRRAIAAPMARRRAEAVAAKPARA